MANQTRFTKYFVLILGTFFFTIGTIHILQAKNEVFQPFELQPLNNSSMVLRKDNFRNIPQTYTDIHGTEFTKQRAQCSEELKDIKDENFVIQSQIFFTNTMSINKLRNIQIQYNFKITKFLYTWNSHSSVYPFDPKKTITEQVEAFTQNRKQFFERQIESLDKQVKYAQTPEAQKILRALQDEFKAQKRDLETKGLSIGLEIQSTKKDFERLQKQQGILIGLCGTPNKQGRISSNLRTQTNTVQPEETAADPSPKDLSTWSPIIRRSICDGIFKSFI